MGTILCITFSRLQLTFAPSLCCRLEESRIEQNTFKDKWANPPCVFTIFLSADFVALLGLTLLLLEHYDFCSFDWQLPMLSVQEFWALYIYIYIYIIKCGCLGELVLTSTNFTGPEINDHVSFQWFRDLWDSK
jgi:hypothetical protein